MEQQDYQAYHVFWDGQWITYTPLPGIDTTHTHSALQIAAAVYAKTLAEGKGQLEAHCAAEAAAFNAQNHAAAS